MATGVVCNVVHLTHSPPVPVLLDGMALPRPLPTCYSPLRKLAKPRLGAFRWGRPTSMPPASQVKSWALNPDAEEELRESLVVLGPRNVVTPVVRSTRALTAPPASLSSSVEQVGIDYALRDDRKTPPQSSLSFKDMVPRGTDDVVTIFPVRPPISSRGKVVPGRLFAKPALTEDQADQLGYFQHAKTSSSRPHSWFASDRRAASRGGRPIDLSLSVTNRDYLYTPGPVFNQGGASKSQQLYMQDIVLRPRIFTIKTSRNGDSRVAKNDAATTDSQWAEFTGTKRLRTPGSKLGASSEFKDTNFAVVLQGHRKHLHNKPMPEPELLGEAFLGDCGLQSVVGSGGPDPINVVPTGGKESHKGGTEMTGQSDTTGTHANLVAPLNSPTDHKDAFPELAPADG